MRLGLPRFRKAGKTRGLVPLPEIGSNTKANQLSFVLSSKLAKVLRCTVKKLKDDPSRSDAAKSTPFGNWPQITKCILLNGICNRKKSAKEKAQRCYRLISYPTLYC